MFRKEKVIEQPAEYPDLALTQAILRLKGFRVSRNKVPKSGPTVFGRRHYYLIILSIGESKVHYDDHTFHLDGVCLLLLNPHIPYSTEIVSGNQTGYSCVFTENFIQPAVRLDSLQQSPLFKPSATPVFKLDAQQQSQLTGIFETMIEQEESDYLYKDDLMRNYIQLIVHKALQMRPAEHYMQYNNASLRIVTHFMEMLERQFPIENLNEPLQLKKAQDYASRLSIHVNSLNRATKEITGKSTTTIIAERLTAEAISLLRYTDWSIADIAFTLGFEYPNYFSNFLKKTTGNPPRFYRVR